jgi:hypothetical protein
MKEQRAVSWDAGKLALIDIFFDYHRVYFFFSESSAPLTSELVDLASVSRHAAALAAPPLACPALAEAQQDPCVCGVHKEFCGRIWALLWNLSTPYTNKHIPGRESQRPGVLRRQRPRLLHLQRKHGGGTHEACAFG